MSAAISTPAGSARRVLMDLEERGFVLRSNSKGNLVCSPKSELTPEDIAGLKRHKTALLSLVDSNEEYRPSPSSSSSPPGTFADAYGESGGDDPGDDPPDFVHKRHQEAQRLGLVARFSFEFGYISIHDPTSGEWHDVETKSAPGWAKAECFKRRELRKEEGIKRLLTRAELEEIYAEERRAAELTWGAIDENAVAMDAKGVVYEDYIED